MLKNYFRIAWRNLWKNKMYSFVNLLGLTTGIVSCMLIALYISHEMSFDRFNKNGDRIARVIMEYGDNASSQSAAVTGTKAGPQFKRSFPAVQAFARTWVVSRVVAKDDKAFVEQKVLFADPALFSMFSFPLLQGNAGTALDTKDKIVVTKSMARKYFGTEDVIGKTLRVGKQRTFQITAVAADAPDNSQIPFDFILPFDNVAEPGQEDWWTANYATYLMVEKPEQLSQLQSQITAFMKTPQVRKEANLVNEAEFLTYHLEPLYNVHLHSTLPGYVPNGNLTYIYILSCIALLILVIACINYTNLATAQAAGRVGEISIRKVLGAERKSLFMQYMGESMLLTFLALIVGMLVSTQLLPLFNNVTGKSLTAAALFTPLALGGMLLLGILVSLLAGGYPALVLSNTKLQQLLKSGFRLASSGGKVRKSLIVLQFSISVFLMLATMVILQQLSFIRKKSLGYDKEHVVVLPIDYAMLTNYEDLKAAIRRDPSVLQVAGAYESPTSVGWSDGITTTVPGPTAKNFPITALPTDLDFVQTMGIQIIAGTNFTPADELLRDTANHRANYRHTFILNETAVRQLGWTPEEAIGKTIYKNEPGTIKAVIKDFHFSSLHERIGPLMLFLNPEFVNQVFVKIRGTGIQASLAHLESIYKQRAPHRPFDYHFLDEEYDTLYKAETQTAGLFGTFAGIAIILACLGLFALAAFTTVQRTKEIGIRKVLGATVLNIVQLISQDFLKLVLISCCIAFPLAWWLAGKWLQDFAYRIHMQWWFFAVVALAATGVALFSVGVQALRAAMANPVKSLKSE